MQNKIIPTASSQQLWKRLSGWKSDIKDFCGDVWHNLIEVIMAGPRQALEKHRAIELNDSWLMELILITEFNSC